MPLRRLWDWDVDGNLLTLGAWDPEMSPAVEDGGLCGTGSSGTAAFRGAGPGTCGIWQCRFQCVLFGATARWGEIGVIYIVYHSISIHSVPVLFCSIVLKAALQLKIHEHSFS